MSEERKAPTGWLELERGSPASARGPRGRGAGADLAGLGALRRQSADRGRSEAGAPEVLGTRLRQDRAERKEHVSLGAFLMGLMEEEPSW